MLEIICHLITPFMFKCFECVDVFSVFLLLFLLVLSLCLFSQLVLILFLIEL